MSDTRLFSRLAEPYLSFKKSRDIFNLAQIQNSLNLLRGKYPTGLKWKKFEELFKTIIENNPDIYDNNNEKFEELSEEDAQISNFKKRKSINYCENNKRKSKIDG